VAILAFLQLYVNGTGMDWTTASGIAATAADKGHGLAQSLHAWTWQFLDDINQLPVSLYGGHIKSVIEDEDMAQYIHLHLQSLDKMYLCSRYLHKLVSRSSWASKIHHPTHGSVLDVYHGLFSMGSPRQHVHGQSSM